MFQDHCQGGIGFIGYLPGENFIQDNPQGVDITALIAAFALALFRRHIVRRTGDGAGGGKLRAADDARHAEIGQNGGAAAQQHHIGGLDIAVHHALAVRIGNGGCNVVEDVVHFLQGHDLAPLM